MQLVEPKWDYVAATFDAGDINAIERLFMDLERRPLPDGRALERWLRDESELHSRVGAELARRYVQMSCHTDDATKKQAYLHMEQEVMARVKVLADNLDKKFLGCQALAQLDQDRYRVVVRRRQTQSEIFRPANTELQKQEAELQTRQQGILGAITVQFEGRPHTLQQMAPYMESQDRSQRERAFRASLAERQKAWPELEDIFDELVALRTAMGRNAGFPTYTGFRFLELGRFDYTIEDCLQFHRTVEECVVPAVRELDRERKQKLSLPALRPWDMDVDLTGRPPLRPFATQAELIDLCRKIFARVDPRFADEFEVLVRNDLLDLMSRKGKAPGGYQYQFEDVRLPFIFANGVGVHGDVQTLLHEGGHAFHSLLCRHHDLLAFRDYPIEFAETASMSMELLGLENLAASYPPADAKAAYKKHLEGVLRVLTWIASIDAIQHWIYGRPQHTRAERRTAWLDIRRRFGAEVDWSGCEDALAMQWIGQTHLFNHAFYYVEYGIAQIAALQVWSNYRKDPKAAIAAYRAALALGGSRPLPELFAAAKVRFDLSPSILRGIVADVMQKLRA